jgi:intein-encoded DNA endonuclease-like protein
VKIVRRLPPDVHDRVLELRGLGISYAVIARLITHDFGLEVTDEQMRRYCRKRGVPADESRRRDRRS